MGANSHIGWTDHTFNPWIGCTKVSPGCAHCYAAAQDKFRAWTPEGWGRGKPRKRTKTWGEPIKWDRDAAELCSCDSGNVLPGGQCDYCGLWTRRPRVFSASLADWLDDEVPIEWLADFLQLIHQTPNLDYLLLTKRPQNWLQRMCTAFEHIGQDEAHYNARPGAYKLLEGWLGEYAAQRIPQNLWIGTTVEDQARADVRIPELLKIPAKVRFLSCEPLLEQVGLIEWFGNTLQQSVAHHQRTNHPCSGDGYGWECDTCGTYHEEDDPVGIHWVICGGESGRDARPMNPHWAQSLRDQCQAAGVPFFFKQWGEWIPRMQAIRAGIGIGTEGMPAKAYANARPLDGDQVYRLGTHKSGRLLDGREWSEFPEGVNRKERKEGRAA